MLKNKSGQALSEYMIITFLIAAGTILMVQGIGKQAYTKLELIKNRINNEVKFECIESDCR